MPQPEHTNPAGSAGVLQVLLAEQKHIDAQIETMMDLQLKILGFLFPALAAAGGWMFSVEKGLNPIAEGEVLLALIAVMCFGILLSVICYSLSAEYSRYKSEVLGSRLQQLLNSDNSLDGGSWGKSDFGHTLVFALAGLWITIAAALCIVLVIATKLLSGNSTLTIRASLCLAYFISSLSLFSVVLSLHRTTRSAFSHLAGRRSHFRS
jgi:ABC-type Fe3+ transport system permease subunit